MGRRAWGHSFSIWETLHREPIPCLVFLSCDLPAIEHLRLSAIGNFFIRRGRKTRKYVHAFLSHVCVPHVPFYVVLSATVGFYQPRRPGVALDIEWDLWAKVNLSYNLPSLGYFVVSNRKQMSTVVQNVLLTSTLQLPMLRSRFRDLYATNQ